MNVAGSNLDRVIGYPDGRFRAFSHFPQENCIRIPQNFFVYGRNPLSCDKHRCCFELHCREHSGKKSGEDVVWDMLARASYSVHYSKHIGEQERAKHAANIENTNAYQILARQY
jgi:hypothetical protein